MYLCGRSTALYVHERLSYAVQKAGDSARTEVYAIEEYERVQAEAALAKEQEEAILVGSASCSCPCVCLMLCLKPKR